MRVQELVEKFQKLDPLLEVVVIDDRDFESNYLGETLWIEDVSIDYIKGGYRIVDLRFNTKRR